MKLFRLTLLGSMLLLPVAMGAAGADNPAPALSAPSQKVVDYLVADWSTRFHSTTIPHAMENMGMPVDDGQRLEIIEHLRQNTKLSRNLSYWGANNYVLTNDERRLAKLLLNAERDGRGLPSLKSAAKTIGMTEKELTASLGFMAKVDFLEADSRSSLGFKLAQKASLWGGPLRHNYHTIHIAGEDKFDVWWAVDFLLLVSSDKFDSGTTVRLEDSCAHGTENITLVVTDGEITKVDPPTVMVQQGGGWSVDNLFSSEEHLTDWLETYPEYNKLKHQTIHDFLAGRESR